MYLDVSKYTLKGLQANVLPPLEEWKAEWKTKSSIKIINLSKNFRVQANYRKNNLNRIDDFYRIQQYYEFDCDFRRFMCFQVRNHAILAGMSNEEAKKK